MGTADVEDALKLALNQLDAFKDANRLTVGQLRCWRASREAVITAMAGMIAVTVIGPLEPR